MYSNFFQWGPSRTPTVVKQLLIWSVIISIFAALTNGLFAFLGYHGPQYFLGLSWFGLVSYYIWQPLTYLFVQDGGSQGITLFFLTGLAFNMYLLWILGTSVQNRLGNRQFLMIYLLTGAVAGLVATFVMPLAEQYTMLAGPAAGLIGLFVIWTMLHKGNDLFLFFIIPVKVKWLLGVALGGSLLMSLSQFDLVSFALYLSAAIFSYLYGALAFKLKSPFAFMAPIDALLGNNHAFKTKSRGPNSKIVDIIDVTPMPTQDDDTFVDAMLTKISKHGEGSLSPMEKQRLDRISKMRLKKD